MHYSKLWASTAALAIIAGSGVASAADKPTFSKDIAPILFENCTSCHQPGQSAPMSLLSYREVRPWAKSILKNVQERTMPPWHASPEFGHFKNDRSLSQEDIDTITDWVNSGTPRGDASDLPAMPTLKAGDWALGEPDLVVSYKEVSL
ncbi:MAG: cytochrome c, partial [Candidatus Hydrogenedentota bacterium]